MMPYKLFIFDGLHWMEVFGFRHVMEENYNPMVHHLLDKVNIEQVRVMAFGELVWINIPKKYIQTCCWFSNK